MRPHIEVLFDSFTDYAGREHHFVIAAISEVLNNPSVKVDETRELKKGLHLGISICNPVDTFNERIGVLKATARAQNSEPVLYVTDPGLINTTMVHGLLRQEADYIKNNPEKYITGYAEAKSRYEHNQEILNIANNFSEVERIVIDNIKKNPRFLDNVNIYLDWLDKCKKQEK